MEALHSLIEGGAAELGARIAWAPTGTSALALARHAPGEAVFDGFRAPLAKILDPLPL
ncbi:MAG: hypothetical protein ACLGIY_12920 [Betaproteobacteria bacterium]